MASRSPQEPPERSTILIIGGFSDAVLVVVVAFLANDYGHGRFVAEVVAVELVTWLRARPKAPVCK